MTRNMKNKIIHQILPSSLKHIFPFYWDPYFNSSHLKGWKEQNTSGELLKSSAVHTQTAAIATSETIAGLYIFTDPLCLAYPSFCSHCLHCLSHPVILLSLSKAAYFTVFCFLQLSDTVVPGMSTTTWPFPDLLLSFLWTRWMYE